MKPKLSTQYDSPLYVFLFLLISGIVAISFHWGLSDNSKPITFSGQTHVEELPPDTQFFGPGDVVIYYDPAYPADPGTSGATAVNRVGFVSSDYSLLVLIEDPIFGYLVKKIPFQNIAELQNLSARTIPFPELRNKVAAYFEKYQYDPYAFFAGKAALFYGNKDPFVRGTLFSPYRTYKTEADREVAWQQFIGQLHVGDRIVTFNHSSIISYIIAHATHGPWSHIAVYLGDGEISEFVTSGYRRTSIEIYKPPIYSVAAYRYIDALDRIPTREEVLAGNCCARPGVKYDYVGAIISGWDAYNGDFAGSFVPNSIMYLGTAQLVAEY